MRIALGSDEVTLLTTFVIEELQLRGHDVSLIGPPAGNPIEWADVGLETAGAVASGGADMGVCFCWTGTGVSIAANKVVGVRAALCGDAETARGARRWNDANVLVMSLRTTTTALAREMLDAWFSAEVDTNERANIAKVTN